jgi:hypothetical protein
VVGPTHKRKAVGHLRKQLKFSERCGCWVVSRARLTQPYRRKPNLEGEPFRGPLVEQAGKHALCEYHRGTALLRGEGWRASSTLANRACREEGLEISPR